MGADEAVAQGAGRPDRTTVEGEVVELLPSAMVRVKLANEALILAHAASASKLNFVRIRPGDRVEVVLSPDDRTRGRITKLLK